MLRRIETPENVPGFLEGVKNREERLMASATGLQELRPAGRIIKQHMDDVFAATEYNPLVEIAQELEKRALDDEYFTDRKLYPNVDYYSGIIYEALQIPTDMFTVIFAIPRTRAGYRSGWRHDDPEQKIAAHVRSTPASSTATTCRSQSAKGPRRSSARRPPAEAPAPRRLTGPALCIGSARVRLEFDDPAWSDVEREQFDSLEQAIEAMRRRAEAIRAEGRWKRLPCHGTTSRPSRSCTARDLDRGPAAGPRRRPRRDGRRLLCSPTEAGYGERSSSCAMARAPSRRSARR